MSDLSIRAPLTSGLAAIAAFVLGIAGWSVSAPLSGGIIAEGRVEVERNRQVVQHLEGGVIAEILVQEGDRVRAGTVLVRLNSATLRSELAIVEGRLSDLHAQRARLLAERDGARALVFPPDYVGIADQDAIIAAQIENQSRLFDARRAAYLESGQQLRRRIDQLDARANGLAAQISAFRRQADLVSDDLATQQGLHDRGLAPSATLQAIRREAARLDGQLGELTAAHAQVQGQISETRLQITSLDSRRIEEATADLSGIFLAVLELGERERALRHRIDGLNLRAPVEGVVLGLQVSTPREILRPGETAMYIVPQERPLVISAEIAPEQIAAVKVGQTVELKFSGYTVEDVPHLAGKVARVSADALPMGSNGAVSYRAEIHLDPGQADRLGTGALLPGMPVSVFVQTAARSPLAYLVQPFTAYFARALREL